MLATGQRLRPWRWAVGIYLLLGLVTRLALLCYGDTAGDLAPGGIFAVRGGCGGFRFGRAAS
ncbi:MAG: hypothetical protein A3H91_07525 [Gammaproteobacteria bacterium RIFCSPLOWO2_02_FULL_61_13]|nr:MAG: hypothetical protein A3H91_07525 [Gammaproteobacteria bacterium RIFCSPLOWO2_02_FULL_61_13]